MLTSDQGNITTSAPDSQGDNGSPPWAEQKGHQGSTRHIQKQNAVEVPAQHQAYIVEHQASGNDDACLVHQEIRSAAQRLGGKEINVCQRFLCLAFM
jgi:hypothetical protein